MPAWIYIPTGNTAVVLVRHPDGGTGDSPDTGNQQSSPRYWVTTRCRYTVLQQVAPGCTSTTRQRQRMSPKSIQGLQQLVIHEFETRTVHAGCFTLCNTANVANLPKPQIAIRNATAEEQACTQVASHRATQQTCQSHPQGNSRGAVAPPATMQSASP